MMIEAEVIQASKRVPLLRVDAIGCFACDCLERMHCYIVETETETETETERPNQCHTTWL
jgi:hypothetical protein